MNSLQQWSVVFSNWKPGSVGAPCPHLAGEIKGKRIVTSPIFRVDGRKVTCEDGSQFTLGIVSRLMRKKLGDLYDRAEPLRETLRPERSKDEA